MQCLQPPPNLGIPLTDLQSDPNTPRAVLNHSLVVAAVASLPTLSPVLPVLSHEPDYCLAAKRKAADDNVYEEVKRLKLRNDFLETQMEAHKRHHIAMMEKIRHMESIINANAGPPPMPQYEGSVTHPSPY